MLRSESESVTEVEKNAPAAHSLHSPLSTLHVPGFTLLEVLVALVIFGIITLALSIAMSSALRSRVLAEQRQDDNENARALFAILGRDLQSAYGSKNDPNSLFMIGGGGQSGGSGGSGGSGNSLLMLSTQTHRIATTDANVDPTAGATGSGASPLGSVSSTQGGTDPPQQSVELVRYDFDPQAGTLTRVTQVVPNVQTLQSTPPAQENVIAGSLVSITLQGWDPFQSNWRDSWDFEQPNLPPPDTAAQTMGFPQTTGNSTTGQTAAGASGTTGTGTGDVGLPSAMQVMVVMRRKDGSTYNVSIILPIVSPAIQDYPYTGGQQSDPNAPPAAVGAGGTGTGGAAAGQ